MLFSATNAMGGSTEKGKRKNENALITQIPKSNEQVSHMMVIK